MTGQPTLKDHGARTIIGVYSRVAGRLLAFAFAFGIWHKWLIGQPNKRSRAIGEFQLAEKGSRADLCTAIVVCVLREYL